MNRKMDLRVLLVVELILLVGLLPGPDKSGAMIPEDILTMKTVALDDLSPDGRYLLYGITSWDPVSEQRRTTLYRRDLDVVTPFDDLPDLLAVLFYLADGKHRF